MKAAFENLHWLTFGIVVGFGSNLKFEKLINDLKYKEIT
jgi:hypothetical protein